MFDKIDENIPRFATMSTAKRGIFSSILSNITGLADQDDVNQIADLMRKVERGVLLQTGCRLQATGYRLQTHGSREHHILRQLSDWRKTDWTMFMHY